MRAREGIGQLRTAWFALSREWPTFGVVKLCAEDGAPGILQKYRFFASLRMTFVVS
jgi:hypothetical protein